MLGVFLSEGFKACLESSLAKDSRHAWSLSLRRIQGMLGVFLSEGFKACLESSLAKDSRHAWSLP